MLTPEQRARPASWLLGGSVCSLFWFLSSEVSAGAP